MIGEKFRGLKTFTVYEREKPEVEDLDEAETRKRRP